MEIANILKQYKTPSGSVDFPSIMKVPTIDRIYELAKRDYNRINMLIIGALTMAFEAINFKRSVNELQVLAISEAIIEEAEQDNLSLEDVLLFLQGLVRGKYSFSRENMDIGRFFECFEEYRQERHESVLLLRENQHLQFKSLGDATRTAKEDPLSEHFSKMADTLHGLKDSLRETKREYQKLKDIDNF